MAELAKTMLKELEKNNGKEKKKKKPKEKSLDELLNLLPTSKKLSTSAKRKYPQNVWYGLNGSSSKSSKRKRNYNKGKSKLQKASKNGTGSLLFHLYINHPFVFLTDYFYLIWLYEIIGKL